MTISFGDLNGVAINKGGAALEIQQEEFMGGGSPSDTETDMDYITIASEGNGIDFGDFTSHRQLMVVSALASSTREYGQVDIKSKYS